MPYAIIDPDGEVRDLVDDADDAIQAAAQYAPYVSVENGPQVQSMGGLGGAELGAVNLERPEHALKMSGLRPMSLPTDRTMSLEEAHEKLLPFFPTKRFIKKRKGVEVNEWIAVASYDTPKKMSVPAGALPTRINGAFLDRPLSAR
jgi:hypothetical protein